jgi:phage-related protein
MDLESDVIAEHLTATEGSSTSVFQVYPIGDARAQKAADGLRKRLEGHGWTVRDLPLESTTMDDRQWKGFVAQAAGATAVLWLRPDALQPLWNQWQASGAGPDRVYLSTSLFGTEPVTLPQDLWQRVYLVHTSEVPNRTPALLARASGWLRAKKIYAPAEAQIQGNAFLALRMSGEAAKRIGGFFKRDYFLERIEHMAENAVFTSVYPKLSLAPGQRFLSRGAYITQFQPGGGGRLVAATDWLVPKSD